VEQTAVGSWEELGARIAFARTAAGLTQEELSARLDIHRSAVARLERGDRRLDALELSRLAEALGRRVAWFVSSPPQMIASHRRGHADEPAVARLESELETAARDVELLSEINELSEPEPDELGRSLDSLEDAERAAGDARHLLAQEDGPLPDVQGVAERFGLYALSLDLGPEVIDGGYVRLQRLGAAVVNGRVDWGRRRFNVAHELGHHLLADEYTTDFAIGQPREDRERLINAFAIHLLAPRGSVTRRWDELRGHAEDRTALIHIAAEYRLSWSATCTHARNLDLVDTDHRGVLEQRPPTSADYVELNLGFTEELAPPGVPAGFARAAIAAYRRNKIGSRRVVELLRGTVAEEGLPAPDELPLDALRAEFAIDGQA
jgi:Zn-dependent peptidase ImmA (M78 family)/DNA-binding XRE family transcriptional regulator